jgi:hypothetical protein
LLVVIISGRPAQVTIPENMDAIHSMILDNWKIYAKKIAETLAMARERVRYIIHEILDMRMLPAKWIPKCLNADQKHDQVQPKNFFLDGLKKSEQQSHKCVWSSGRNM